MRWYDASICESVQTGTDSLGNPICEIRPTGRAIIVRTAPRRAVRDDNEGNPFRSEERTLITCSDYSLLDGAAAIEVGGIRYDVLWVSSRESPIAIRVRRCKGDGNPDC